MPNHKRIFSIVLPLILFFFLLAIFGRSENSLFSLITTFIAGLFSLYLVSFGIKKLLNKNFFWILISTYSFKVLFGVAHWLIFIQPDYFTKGGNIDFLTDYVQMHDLMSIAADSRLYNGFFSMVYNVLFLISKDAVFLYVLSTLYYFTGNHALNICVFNSFISTLTALIVLHLYSLFDKELKQSRFVLLLACLFPMNLIASALMRDIAGQFFIALGVLLLSLKYRTKLGEYISLLFSMILISLQRLIYLIFPFFTYVIIRTKKNKLIFVAAFIFIAILFFNTLINLPIFSYFKGYVFNAQFDISRIGTFLLLPLRLIRALIGPIPWTNVFSPTMETTYLSTAYLQSIFNLTVLILLIPGYLKGQYKIGIIEIMLMLFLFTGIVTPDIHIYYFSTAFIFLIPYLSEYKFSFVKTMIIVIIVYLVFNILYINLGLAGTGIWESIQ